MFKETLPLWWRDTFEVKRKKEPNLESSMDESSQPTNIRFACDSNIV